MELLLQESPLADDVLRAVADLYGRYNAAYRDVDFCRWLFEANPNGRALHALARDERGSLAGHYAVLPLDAWVDGARRRTGKGEAFVVHPDHRASTVSLGGEPEMPIGLALPFHLYRFAHEHGLDPVHMIADAEVGRLHRMAGCRTIPLTRWKGRLHLRPPAGDGSVATAAIAYAQRAAHGIATALTGTRASGFEARVPDANDCSRIAHEIPAAEGWTLAIDEPMLAWMASAGRMRLIVRGNRPEDYALLARRTNGTEIEIVLWRQPSAQASATRALLAGAVARADRAGVASITVSDNASWYPAEAAALHAARAALGFRQRLESAQFYVNAQDPYFLDASRLHYTPLFHAIF